MWKLWKTLWKVKNRGFQKNKKISKHKQEKALWKAILCKNKKSKILTKNKIKYIKKKIKE